MREDFPTASLRETWSASENLEAFEMSERQLEIVRGKENADALKKQPVASVK
jgi:hypothetical protein